MSTRYIDWKEAHKSAQEQANESGSDVAIRKTLEYGKTGYNVSYASRNDSDYALAEIVQPAHFDSLILRTLRTEGDSTARQIARIVKLPYEPIYTFLSQLEVEGKIVRVGRHYRLKS
jgi:predicted Rossmann fold nucleotide-binding protein DprA/Smf involved in DNA uptake